MQRNLIAASLAVGLGLASGVAFAANAPSFVRGNQLPEIQCTTTHCNLVERSTPHVGARTLMGRTIRPTATVTPAAADPTPSVVGPPAGQRYLWKGAGFPGCQDIQSATGSNPYVYISGASIPVPLGSTHISLLGTFQVNLGGGPAGDAGDVGMLQVRRTGGAWAIVDAGYAFTISGASDVHSLYNIGSYQALVDLAALPGGTTVPSEIDVRVIAYPLYTTGFTRVDYNSVCWGQLQLSF